MSEPETAAGRALRDDVSVGIRAAHPHCGTDPCSLCKSIARVEAEAVALYREDLAAKVRALLTNPWTHGSDDDDLCPNCVTPWKCNGPHKPTPKEPDGFDVDRATVLRLIEGSDPASRSWPGRAEMEAMTDAEVNDFLESRGLDVRVIEGSDPASPETVEESVPPVLAAWFNDRASAIRDVVAHRASPPEYPGMALVPVADLDRLARYAELPKADEGSDPASPITDPYAGHDGSDEPVSGMGVIEGSNPASPEAPLDVERLARAIKSLTRDFNWQSENVRLDLVVGPIPYGPGPWTIGGNPDGNVAVAIAQAYSEAESPVTGEGQ